jgi:anti-sigma factor RsiW
MLLDSKSSPCEIIHAHITALLDDELSQTDAATLRSHIRGCALCTQAFEQIQQTLKTADAWNIQGSYDASNTVGTDLWEALEKQIAPESNNASPESVSQDDLRGVLTEMRALRTEIQELRGEVGLLRRLLSATRQAAPAKSYRPLSSPQMMPLPLPENSGIGLL